MNLPTPASAAASTSRMVPSPSMARASLPVPLAADITWQTEGFSERGCSSRNEPHDGQNLRPPWHVEHECRRVKAQARPRPPHCAGVAYGTLQGIHIVSQVEGDDLEAACCIWAQQSVGSCQVSILLSRDII